MYVATAFPASDEAVIYLLSHGPGETVIDGNKEDTRSGWYWFTLANGDTVLGFYPQGDYGFSGTEIARENDWDLARQNQTIQDIYRLSDE